MGITFLYPSYLWGLLLVAIPIVIHLFNFRQYKTVYFPNISLLKNVQEESKKTRTLKNWLILLIRILIITCLVIAFAYPIEKSENKSGRKIVSLYIDNSFSMDANGLDGNKFNLAKSFADQIIQEFDPNTKFQIITNNFQAKHQMLYSKEKALDLISEIPISNKTKDFQSVLNRQLSVIGNQPNTNPHIYWISDFQALNDSNLFNPDSIPVNMCLLSSESNVNLSIDSVWFQSPVRATFGNEEIHYSIKNYSQEDFKALNVQLDINGKITQQTVSIDKEEKKEFSFKYPQPTDSIINGKVSLSDGGLAFDNEIKFGYTLQKKTKVYVITDEPEFYSVVNKLFKNDSLINYKIHGPNAIDYARFLNTDLILLGELKEISNGLVSELNKAAENGCNIAFFPSKNGNLNDYQKMAISMGGIALGNIDSTEIQIESVQKNHSFFNNVFKKEKEISANTKKAFPILKHHFSIGNQNIEPLIFKNDGTPYLAKNDNYYIFASGISTENSSIKNHALVVPLFYQLIFNSIKSNDIQYFTDDYLKISTQPEPANSAMEIIPENGITYKTQISPGKNFFILPSKHQTTGHYVTRMNKSLKGAFAINNNREESKEINKQITNIKSLQSSNHSFKLYYASTGNAMSILNQSLNSKTYWKAFLIAGLVFLFLEIIIIRIFNR